MTTTSETVRVNLEPYWDDQLSNQYVAEKLDVNVNTVSSYRNGNIKNPKIEILIKFRNFFSERHNRKLILEDLLKLD